jgi:hypothetical protein
VAGWSGRNRRSSRVIRSSRLFCLKRFSVAIASLL